MDRGETITECVKVSAALFFLYFVFDNLSLSMALDNLLFSWQWGRLIVVVIAFYVVNKMITGLWNSWGPVRSYLYTFYGVTIVVLMAWSGLGTYTEGADPLFGGGVEVVDFIPTEVERDLFGSRLFFDLLIPALVGTFLAGRRVEK